MKISNIFLVLFLTALAFTGCKKDKDWVEINSLHVDTDTLFLKQRIKMWMSVNTNNLEGVSYTWSCDSGRFIEPQGLSEMVWEAPITPGEYNISCTAKIGSSSETRVHKILVTNNAYLEDFNSIFFITQFVASPGVATRKVENVNGFPNGYCELSFKDYSKATAFDSIRLGGNITSVSISAKLGLIANFNNNVFKIGSTTYQNTLAYEYVNLRDPDRLDNKFIRFIRFEWYPQKVGGGTGVYGSSDPVSNGTPHYGIFSFTYDSATVKNKVVKVLVPTSVTDLLLEQGGARKNFAFSVTSDYTVVLYIDGVKAFETSLIKDWRANGASQDDIYFLSWRFIYSNGASIYKMSQIYFDDVKVKLNGTVLTGAN